MKLKWTKTEPKLSQNEVKMKPKSMQNQYKNDKKKLKKGMIFEVFRLIIPLRRELGGKGCEL